MPQDQAYTFRGPDGKLVNIPQPIIDKMIAGQDVSQDIMALYAGLRSQMRDEHQSQVGPSRPNKGNALEPLQDLMDKLRDKVRAPARPESVMAPPNPVEKVGDFARNLAAGTIETAAHPQQHADVSLPLMAGAGMSLLNPVAGAGIGEQALMSLLKIAAGGGAGAAGQFIKNPDSSAQDYEGAALAGAAGQGVQEVPPLLGAGARSLSRYGYRVNAPGNSEVWAGMKDGEGHPFPSQGQAQEAYIERLRQWPGLSGGTREQMEQLATQRKGFGATKTAAEQAHTGTPMEVNIRQDPGVMGVFDRANLSRVPEASDAATQTLNSIFDRSGRPKVSAKVQSVDEMGKPVYAPEDINPPREDASGPALSLADIFNLPPEQQLAAHDQFLKGGPPPAPTPAIPDKLNFEDFTKALEGGYADQGPNYARQRVPGMAGRQGIPLEVEDSMQQAVNRYLRDAIGKMSPEWNTAQTALHESKPLEAGLVAADKVRDAEGLRLRMKPNIGGIPSTIAYAYETPGRIAGLGMSRLASDFAEAKGLLGPNRPIVPALGRLSFKLSQLGKGQSPDEDQ